MQMSTQDLTLFFITPGRNWSSKAIIAALEHKGSSLQEVEAELGLRTGSLRNAFYRKSKSYEKAIAQKIGLGPDVIWPGRYHSDNHPNS